MDFGEFDIFRLSSESDGEAEGEVENVVGLVHQAASRGDTRQLVSVVQKDPSLLEQPNADGMTPLGQAVLSQQMAAVKRLVKMGADINAQDGVGRTSLTIAAYQGWLDGVVYLLRNGAWQNIADKTGRLPLHAATYHSDPRTLMTLLQSSSPGDIGQTDHEQMTAVHWAAFHKRPEHVRCLIERRAHLMLPDMDGKLPLHWAAQNGCRETCRLLMHAAILRQEDRQGESQAGEGERQGESQGGEGERDKMLRYQDHSGKTAIHFAAAAGHADVIRQLAVYPACQLDSPDPDNRTPLHWAAAMGHVQCVQALLDLGVKANVKDADGGTPLSYAQQSAHGDCVRILEEALNIPAGFTSRQKAQDGGGGGGGKKGKTPLDFLKGLFRSRKDTNPGASSCAPLHPPPPPFASPSGTLPPPSQHNHTASPLNGTHGCEARYEGANERLSLPSIRRGPSMHSDCLTVADVSGSSPSSLPSDFSAKMVEAGRDENKPARGEEAKYKDTHVPALPPLLPDLHYPDRHADPTSARRESGGRVPVVDGELLRSPRELGPLRGGPPPQSRQLNTRAADRLHDGMLFQRSVTDFRPAEPQDTSKRLTTPAYPGLKGSRKRGLPPPHHHSPLSHQQPSGTPRNAVTLDLGHEEGARSGADHSHRKGGSTFSVPHLGVPGFSAVSTPKGAKVLPQGSSVSLPQSPSVLGRQVSKITLPQCSNVRLQQDRSDRVLHRQESRVSLPKCSSVPLTWASTGEPQHFPMPSSDKLVLDDVNSPSNASSLPDPSSSCSLSCTSSSSVLRPGREKAQGTPTKSDLKLMDI